MPEPQGRAVDGGYRIELFAEQDTVTTADVVAFWTGEAQLAEAEARRRISELLLVATHPDAGLVGALSTYLKHNQQLRMDLWYVRAFVAPAHRQSLVAQTMVLTGCDVLRDRYVSGQDTRGAGVLGEVENPMVKRLLNHAVWPRGLDFVFIGENIRGDHVRVIPFPGALAPPPPRVP